MINIEYDMKIIENLQASIAYICLTKNVRSRISLSYKKYLKYDQLK